MTALSRTAASAALALLLSGAGLMSAAPALAQSASAEETRVVEGFEGPAKPKGIGFRAIASVPLNGRVAGLEDRVMRTRVWTVQPDGVVPVHTHRNRPAFVYVLSGSILEFRNTLAEPHRANAGDLSAEGLGVVHYWRNDGETPAILWAVDLFQDAKSASAEPAATAAAEGAMVDGVEPALLGALPLGAEEIGVEGGDFRVHRLEIAAGDDARFETQKGDVAVVFVERGTLLRDGAPFHAGQVVTLDGGQSVHFENGSGAEAALLIADVVAVR